MPRLLERLDPVVHGSPDGATPGPLTSEKLAELEHQGFLFFPEFFAAAEVDALQEELVRLRELDEVRGTPQAILEPDSGDIRSIFEIHFRNDRLGALAEDARLARITRQILGGNVYVHQSRINYKPGFRGREFYWHSDFETWHVEDGMPRMRAVSCSISLTDNRPTNGPLMVIPGSHRRFLACVGETPEEHYKQSLRRQEYGVPDDESLARMVEQGGIEAPCGPAGSMVLFDCNLMHGSNSNITPWPRSNIFFVYNSMENTLLEPFSGQRPRPEFIASRRFVPVR